jgi:hypothetical protein
MWDGASMENRLRDTQLFHRFIPALYDGAHTCVLNGGKCDGGSFQGILATERHGSQTYHHRSFTGIQKSQ